MRIKELTIYGFGRHRNVTVTPGERITIFFGENEAGKTTIHQFILQVLFGFPPKNGALLRYEPKDGAAYGGKLLLEDPEYGQFEVERVRGRSAGDVTVRFSDGTTAGQEKLSAILRQYDRTAFESIFSFSLFQLQGLEQMDADELSRTLLSSGTTGVDLLLQLEKKLEKEKGELFKKSGKNPRMNIVLKELRELETAMKEQRSRMDEYGPSMERLHETGQLITQKRQELDGIRQEAGKLQAMRLRLPAEEERKKLTAELERLGNAVFPPNGIREQEMLEAKKMETEAVLSRSRYELEALTDRTEGQADPEHLTVLKVLLDKEQDWQDLRQQEYRCASEQTRLLNEQQHLLDRLGAADTETAAKLRSADSSLAAEQRLQGLAAAVERAEQAAQSCETEWRRAKEQEDRSLAALRQHQAGKPSAEDEAAASKWPGVRMRLAEAKAYTALAGGQQADGASNAGWVIIAAALIAMAAGAFLKQWALVLFGLLTAAAAVILLKKRPAEDRQDDREQEMRALVKAYAGKEEDYEKLCSRVAEYARTEEQLQLTVRQSAGQREALGAELARIRDTEEENGRLLQQALAVHGFQPYASPGMIPELFRMLNKLQETDRLLADLTDELLAIRSRLDTHRRKAEDCLGRELPETDLYTVIRQYAGSLQEQVNAAETGRVQAEQLKRTIHDKENELKTYREKELALFAKADAADKKTFYEAYDRSQRRQALTARLDSLEAQLASQRDADVRDISETELAALEDHQEQRLADIEKELTALTEEQAALRHKTEALLTEDAHLLTQQKFESKKAEFNELAMEWSVKQAVAEAIRQTMADLKETKLPAVLQRANRHFHHVTGGAYDTLAIGDSDHFLALRSDGQSFSIAELSQATKEQAYLSLRLALAGELLGDAPFPIIMDDPFVHFDGRRLSRMIGLLEILAADHQLFIFTCHEELAAQWPDAAIINVSEIGNSQEAVKL
ncbi:ATP-binding protein [Sporosarcina koreensis]|uniref:ATP-binding protein n=1 Tax=Sporosarcina koreensis TaxID=334735 RepID=UPI00058F8B45|nr:AAA family ATPase [Sporosarcina koreensis]